MIFPNVPNLPGVPPLARSALTQVATVQGLLAGLGNTLQYLGGQPQLPLWGIYDSSFRSVVDADNFLSFSNRNQSNIANFPLQGGKLAQYNKVFLPGTQSVRISKGGTLTDRAHLLRQIEVLYRSLEKFTILTPEKSYLNVNVESYEVVREDKDQAFYLTGIDIFFQEIQSVTAVFTNTPASADTSNAKNPSAQPPVNQGVVQPATPSNTAQNEATTVLAGGAP